MATQRKNQGFSLIELMVVVGIIGVLAAISVPLIFNYMQVYRLRTASQEVVGELQSTRMQAIMKNGSRGVAFYVADSNTYRRMNLDLLADPATAAQALGVLRNLPEGVVFDATVILPGVSSTGVRFSRLGSSCVQDAGSVDANCQPTALVCLEAQCADNTSTDFTVRGQVDGSTLVGLRDLRSGLTRTLSIELGGRVDAL